MEHWQRDLWSDPILTASDRKGSFQPRARVGFNPPCHHGGAVFLRRQTSTAWSDTDAAYQFLDVCGYNYTKGHYETDHQLHPSRVMMGTESFPVEVAENWELVDKHSYVIGDLCGPAWTTSVNRL